MTSLAQAKTLFEFCRAALQNKTGTPTQRERLARAAMWAWVNGVPYTTRQRERFIARQAMQDALRGAITRSVGNPNPKHRKD